MPHLVAKALKNSHKFDNFSDVEPILTHFTRTCTYMGGGGHPCSASFK